MTTRIQVAGGVQSKRPLQRLPHGRVLNGAHALQDLTVFLNSNYCAVYQGGSVAEWLACWTQAQ